MRRFSLTSSQGNKAFLTALPKFQEEEEWKEVAIYLYGHGWKQAAGIEAGGGGEAEGRNVGGGRGENAGEGGTGEGGTGEVENVEGGGEGGAGEGGAGEGGTGEVENDFDGGEGGTGGAGLGQTFGAIPTLEEYAKSFEANPPQINSPTVLEHIKELVCEGRDKSHISTAQTPRFITTFLEVLAKRVPSSMRDSRAVPKSTPTLRKKLQKFFDANPKEREYHFFSKKALVEIAKHKKIKVKSNYSVDKLVSIIANPPESNEADQEQMRMQEALENLTIGQKVTHSILSKAFQPHQKGELREHCSLGHKLELPILLNWVKNELKSRGFPLRFLEVKSAYTAGLVEKRECPWAKDSIDFILCIQENILGNDNDDMELWGVEIKTRATCRTAISEIQHLQNADREKHICIDFSEVSRILPNLGERYQILHHAYVYGFKKIVLIVGDNQSEIIQSTIVNFSDLFLENYGKVIGKIKDLGLFWVYGEQQTNNIPQTVLDVANLDVKTLNGSESLQSSFYLWKRMMTLPLPFPPLRRIIPIYCAHWNQVKGGSDTTTKLMDTNRLFPPRLHTNAQTMTVSRIMSIFLVLCHRLNQVFTAHKNLTYPSLYHYRNAASHRCTYFELLLDAKVFFEKELMFNNKENEQTGGTYLTPSLRRRRSSRHSKVNGTTPQQVSFVSRVTGHTPAAPGKRSRNSIEKGNTSVLVEERLDNCTGRPVKIHKFNEKNKRFRGTCSVCTNKTSFYCVGCKLWYCFEAKSTQTKEKDQKASVSNRNFQCFEVSMAQGSKGNRNGGQRTNLNETEHFEISCFVKKHRAAWEKEECTLVKSSPHHSP